MPPKAHKKFGDDGSEAPIGSPKPAISSNAVKNALKAHNKAAKPGNRRSIVFPQAKGKNLALRRLSGAKREYGLKRRLTKEPEEEIRAKKSKQEDSFGKKLNGHTKSPSLEKQAVSTDDSDDNSDSDSAASSSEDESMVAVGELSSEEDDGDFDDAESQEDSDDSDDSDDESTSSESDSGMTAEEKRALELKRLLQDDLEEEDEEAWEKREETNKNSKKKSKNASKNGTNGSAKIVNFYSDSDESDSDDSAPASFGDRKKLAAKLLVTRKTLQIYKSRHELMEHVLSNKVTVLIGETGSGKSTQLPQFLLESSPDEKIAITQPRRVAAISLAKRVSEEYGCTLGKEVGYTVRFQNSSGPSTKIKYLTDGMLLRELMLDNDLNKYSTIILDEAHERTVLTDLLLGFLKNLVQKRDNLRVVVMSATLDAERFANFFDGCPILLVEGKQYPVERFYLPSGADDIVDTVCQSVVQLNSSELSGDILVFLAGQEEIDKCVDVINEVADKVSKKVPLMIPLPLYASLSPVKQQAVFKPVKSNQRKVIFSTNIAETSLTISGVRYVLDTGLRKVKVWKPELGLDTLLTTPISQSSAQQRMGRAGREAPGKCFRLLPESDYANLAPQTEPEILRCDVASALLMLKKAGVDKVHRFPWIQKPSKQAISSALLKLYALKALDDDGKITDLGHKMAVLPVTPHLAGVLIHGCQSGVAQSVIDIVACLSVENLLMNPHAEVRDEVNEKRRNLFPQALKHGDLALLHGLIRMYMSMKDSKDRTLLCKEIAVNQKSLKNVLQIRQQLRGYLEKVCDLSEADDDKADFSTIIKIFLAGFINNTALGSSDRQYRTVNGGHKIAIHPSSMMFGKKIDAIMYVEYVFTTKGYARTVSPIDLAWLQEIAPHFLGNRQRDD
ncbi:putative ATP-dependent RNA helicase DHR2 [Yarrowia sp. C11]|nr:putative ATP-dependent RNA helicase DHR2 [Yarrowia sp. C11]